MTTWTWPERWHAWTAPARDFLFPAACASCHGPLSAAQNFCMTCRDELCAPTGDRCLRCAAPVGPNLDTTEGCHYCRDDSFAFRRVLAIGVYRGRLGQACRLGKQPWSRPLIAALTGLFWDIHAATLLSERIDLIVPVPTDWLRQVTHRGGAPEVFGQDLSRRLQRPWNTQLLRKPRPTPSQAQSPPHLRRRQQREAFATPPGLKLQGARVLLVDDVLTTGATAHSAATTLIRAGAEAVTIAVFARGLGDEPGRALQDGW